jgi:hypothetical protein
MPFLWDKLNAKYIIISSLECEQINLEVWFS